MVAAAEERYRPQVSISPEREDGRRAADWGIRDLRLAGPWYLWQKFSDRPDGVAGFDIDRPIVVLGLDSLFLFF